MSLSACGLTICPRIGERNLDRGKNLWTEKIVRPGGFSVAHGIRKERRSRCSPLPEYLMRLLVPPGYRMTQEGLQEFDGDQ